MNSRVIIDGKEYENMWMYAIDCYLNNEKLLNKTLKKCNISSDNVIGVEKRYAADKNRLGIILKLLNPISNQIEHTIIDVFHGGHNSFQQFIDLAFGFGKNCKNKIIIFDDETDDENPTGNMYAMNSFIYFANKYGLNIYQIRIKTHFIIEMSRLELLEKPPKKPEFDMEDLPGISEFKDAEFWQLYFFPGTVFDQRHELKESCDRLLTNFMGIESDSIELMYYWNRKGLIFKAEEFENEHVLRKVLDNRLYKIKEKYKDWEITAKKSLNGPVELEIIDRTRPSSCFYNLPLKEKPDYANSVIKEFQDFGDFMESVIENYQSP